MKQYTRKQVIKRLKDKLAKGYCIVAAGAGTGISAKFEEEGGADLILVFNSGLYRMHGLGSLSGWMAYGNANDVSLELGEKHILPIVKEAPSHLLHQWDRPHKGDGGLSLEGRRSGFFRHQ